MRLRIVPSFVVHKQQSNIRRTANGCASYVFRFFFRLSDGLKKWNNCLGFLECFVHISKWSNASIVTEGQSQNNKKDDTKAKNSHGKSPLSYSNRKCHSNSLASKSEFRIL